MLEAEETFRRVDDKEDEDDTVRDGRPHCCGEADNEEDEEDDNGVADTTRWNEGVEGIRKRARNDADGKERTREAANNMDDIA